MAGGSALLARLETVLRALLCATVFAMMAITAIDVVSRYVFSAPLRGAFEIVTLLLASSVFLALPLVTRANEHIAVDLLQPLLRGRVGRLQRFAVLAIGAGVVGVVAVQLWRHAGLMAAAGQITGFLEWPLAPLAYLASALCGVTVVVYLVMMAEHARNPRLPPQTAGDPAAQSLR
jgi:TRAP-type C4-dicarboxylate transport system permease small subunit